MELEQATMQLSLWKNGKEEKIKKLVFLWKKVGLCIHKGDMGWVLSHFNSGKSILSYIKTKNDAIAYVDTIYAGFPDWTFTLEEFDKWKEQNPDESLKLKTFIDKIQQEILKMEF